MDDPLILGRYRLVERLATGGSAEVWRAHDEGLDRDVAVKRLHTHLLPDADSRRRLAAEARAAAQLSHPVIAGIYDVEAEGESPAIVMELVDGESLATRIARDGPLGDDEAVRVTADLADALYHAHQRGVIHRDVKPGNVLLSTDGRTRLVDFGIARSLAESAERLTLTGTIMGTLNAMAPEQLAGEPVGPRTDLYGLGVVLHEALTGGPPYAARSPLALAEAQRAGPPRLEGIEPSLAAIVTACLAPDPADRPVHAGALAEALRDWLSGGGASAVALATGASLAAPEISDTAAVTQPLRVVPPAVPEAPPRRPADVRPRRRLARALPLLGAAAGVMLILAALVSALNDGSVQAQSSIPAATPTPPEWLAGLVEGVAEDCGGEVAAEAEAAMTTLTEEQAEQYADDLKEACEEQGGNRGKGRGKDRDNGRGNDD